MITKNTRNVIYGIGGIALITSLFFKEELPLTFQHYWWAIIGIILLGIIFSEVFYRKGER